MDKELLLRYLKTYQDKHDSIMEQYGVKDGFLFEGKYWWDYYKELISDILNKIDKGIVTIEDFSNFYRKFGFGPKLYINSVLGSGIEKLSKLFKFLSDRSIEPNEKLKQVTENQESDFFIRGIGINFITLFLTNYFPDKYGQWNRQIDGALKILGAYPIKSAGEQKSNFYLKINQALLNIKEITGLDSLAQVDNLLFCINVGYLSEKGEIDKKVEKEIKDIEEIEEEKEETEDVHTKMQYCLIKIGINKGYDIWIAQNDSNKSYNGFSFYENTLKELPSFTQPKTLAIAKFVDVIWFKKNTANPVRFFEIEHTTSVYSGLLRLNDIIIDFPITKATVIVPKSRIKLFENQIARRTFDFSGLYEVCEYMTYNDLEKYFGAAEVSKIFD
ncbi:MAG: hypothetical protein M1479_00350 [Actinobacteria bacterium]|nr:hypothetical protein [Actinomycetota bacterium]